MAHTRCNFKSEDLKEVLDEAFSCVSGSVGKRNPICYFKASTDCFIAWFCWRTGTAGDLSAPGCRWVLQCDLPLSGPLEWLFPCKTVFYPYRAWSVHPRRQLAWGVPAWWYRELFLYWEKQNCKWAHSVLETSQYLTYLSHFQVKFRNKHTLLLGCC